MRKKFNLLFITMLLALISIIFMLWLNDFDLASLSILIFGSNFFSLIYIKQYFFAFTSFLLLIAIPTLYPDLFLLSQLWGYIALVISGVILWISFYKIASQKKFKNNGSSSYKN